MEDKVKIPSIQHSGHSVILVFVRVCRLMRTQLDLTMLFSAENSFVYGDCLEYTAARF